MSQNKPVGKRRLSVIVEAVEGVFDLLRDEMLDAASWSYTSDKIRATVSDYRSKAVTAITAAARKPLQGKKVEK